MIFCANCGKHIDEDDIYCRFCGTPKSKELMNVVYETKEWSKGKRNEMEETLVKSGIPHEWDGSEMTVAGEYEKVVDYMLAQLPVEMETNNWDATESSYEKRLFYRPFISDWCIWLGAVAVISGVIGISHEYGHNAIDYILAIVFQWTIFAVCPAGIRRRLRVRPQR
jgi:hypothetical protein